MSRLALGTYYHNANRMLTLARIAADAAASEQSNLPALYELLDNYYMNNGLYDWKWTQYTAADETIEKLKALRTPARRSVEFFVDTIWAGSLDELKLRTDNDAIIEPIQQIWKWSNWGRKKQLAARYLAKYGDLIIKVARRDQYEFTGEIDEETSEPLVTAVPKKVFLQVIDPRNVPEDGLLLDEAGHVVYCRIDIERIERDAAEPDKLKAYTITEIWDEEAKTVRIWKHAHGFDYDREQLGDADQVIGFEEMGIDFVPIVYAPFTEIEDTPARGFGSFTAALDKIDEANRMVTRLHVMLFRFNRAVMGVAARDKTTDGRPMPAPKIDSDALLQGDDTLLRLPGMSEVFSLVPNINYEAHRNAVDDAMEELVNDMPELMYSTLRARTDLSGTALRILLAPAVSRALEARGNAEAALVRAHKMALTMGIAAGLFEESVGSYENGDFEHSFMPRAVLPMAESERASIVQTYTMAGVPLEAAMKRAGFKQDEIEEALASKKREQIAGQQTAAAALLAARREQTAAGSAGLERPG